MAILGTDAPEALTAALYRARHRFPDVSWGIALQGDEWRLLASCGGRVGERRLQACVANNSNLVAVLANSFRELYGEVIILTR